MSIRPFMPDQPITFWQHFDVVSIAIIACVIFVLGRQHVRMRGGLKASISQTMAADKRTADIFALTMCICFPLYYAFLAFWTGPKIAAPVFFYYVLLVSAIAELVFVLVPATAGKAKQLHEIAAATVGAAMLILPASMLWGASDLSFSAQNSIGAFFVCAALLAGLTIYPKTRANTFFINVCFALRF